MLDKSEKRIIDDVDQYGWHGVIICEDEVGPGFEYSIGLMENNHPEIIIFGLPRDVSHEVLWIMFKNIKDGRRFDSSGLYAELLEERACAIRPVHETQLPEYLGYAQWYQRHKGQPETLKAVQCFWPDRNGLFPWENGCEVAVMKAQPFLYEEIGSDS